jgi:hypothetical protein
VGSSQYAIAYSLLLIAYYIVRKVWILFILVVIKLMVKSHGQLVLLG